MIFKKLFFIMLFLFVTTFAFAFEKAELHCSSAFLEVGRSENLELIIFRNIENETISISVPVGISLHFIGKIKDNNSFIYKYRIVAQRPGSYSIEPVVFTSNGIEFRSNKLTLVARERAQKQILPLTDDNLKEHIFLEVKTDSTEIYVNQSGKLNIAVYSDWLDLENVDVSLPRSKDIIFFDTGDQTVNMIPRNETNFVVVGCDTLFYSLVSGDYVIDPISVEFDIAKIPDTQTDQFEKLLNDNYEFYDEFIGYGNSRHIEFKSDPINIKIKPLPENRQFKYFRGNIGHNVVFNVNFSYDKKKTTADFDIIIEGLSQTAIVKPPVFIDTTGFDINKTVISADHEKTKIIISADILSQIHEVPILNLTYFDIIEKKFLEQNKGPFVFEEHTVKMTTADVVSITEPPHKKMMPQEEDMGRLYMLNPKWRSFFFVNLVFLLLWVLAFRVYASHINKLRFNKIYYARYIAIKFYKKIRKKILAYLFKGDQKQFFNCIFELLQGYLSYRLFLPKDSIVKETISNDLFSDNVSQETIDHILQLFNMTYEGLFSKKTFTKKTMMEIFSQLNDVFSNLNKASSL